MNRMKLLMEKRIVAILRDIPAESIQSVVTALYAGGIHFIEITFNQAESDHRETLTGIREAKKISKPDLYIGAGTVLNSDQLRSAVAEGADFILSPNVNVEVIKEAKSMGLLVMPGAFSPTEIEMAHRLGADVVKVFPVEQLGVDYIKSVLAPLRHIKLSAVGGIDETNIVQYLTAGVDVVGIGSNLVNAKIVSEKKFKEIEARAHKFSTLVKKYGAEKAGK